MRLIEEYSLGSLLGLKELHIIRQLPAMVQLFDNPVQILQNEIGIQGVQRVFDGLSAQSRAMLHE